MTERNGKKWSREETILAFELYCRTSFGKISYSNPEIRELAGLLKRTPGSVALKMHNLAHHDPKLKSRNVTAMAHGSKLDLEIFEEFYQNLEELSYQAYLIRSERESSTMINTLDSLEISSIPPGEYRERLIKMRLGQQHFRAAVLNSYDNKCCITGLALPKLLIASHIKPWANCDERTERTNPQNGLCLNSFHDEAFDQGFITIDTTYHIIVSSKLKDAYMDNNTRAWMLSYDGKQIRLPERFLPEKTFIEYHNDVIFRG